MYICIGMSHKYSFSSLDEHFFVSGFLGKLVVSCHFVGRLHLWVEK